MFSSRINKLRPRDVIVLSIIFGILFWILDYVPDYLFVHEGSHFSENIFSSLDGHEIYVRTALSFLIILIGIILSAGIRKRELTEQIILQKSHALGERVKELRCLYQISRLISQDKLSIDDVLIQIVNIIPSTWQYPEITCTQIVYNDQEYKTDNFKETEWNQKADINVFGNRAGILEVYYTKEKPVIDEGPFLKEERTLINSVAREIGLFLEHKKTQAKLDAEKDTAQKYLDIAGVMIIVYNDKQKVTMVNREGCRILGYKEEEIIGKNWFDNFLPQRHREEVRTVYNKLMAGHTELIKHYENPIIRKDGSERLIEWDNSIIEDEMGKVIGILSSGKDITDVKNLEEQKLIHRQQLVQADKMASLGLLVSGMAHEINNPNTLIRLNADVLMDINRELIPILDEYYKNTGEFTVTGVPYSMVREKIIEMISGISKSSVRVDNIVQNLKDFARVDPGNMEERIDINSTITSAVEIVRHFIEKTTNNFITNLDSPIPEITGNSQKLEQVIVNLLINGCQALRDNEQSITISSSYVKRSKNIVVKVADEGVGISEEALRNIVDPFYTTKQDTGGTGLGLSVSYSILKEHGGTLDFISKEGAGTTVTIKLPVNPVQEKKETTYA